MLLIKTDFLVTSTKTAKLDFGLPYHDIKICSLEPSLPDTDPKLLHLVQLPPRGKGWKNTA